MQAIRLLATLLVLGAVGCGSKQSKPAAAPGEPTAAQMFEKNDSGMPGWVERGSVGLTTEDGRRVFYGVGAASGIRNPSLLRQTADNRGRAELAKLFEVFSASLMKDYMDSTGAQNVEQAIKTMTSTSLQGTEVVDRYIGPDGTMYALAALDLQKAMGAIKRAKELGAVATHVEKVSVDDIFDGKSKRAPPPSRPAAVSGAQSGGAPPAASTGSASAPETKGGQKPAWVDGFDPRFPAQNFLCGVGFGPERSHAESGAFAAISRIFVARVESVSKDFMGAYSQTGAPSLDVQSSEALTKISTSKIISGVQIQEVWSDGKQTTYALACLDRPKVANILREQIGQSDDAAGKHLDKAKSEDQAGKVRELARALDSIVQREALNGELRIVDPDGVGVSGPYAHVDIAAALEGAVEQLKVGVTADGPFAGDFRGALIEGLTARGYLVSELDGGSTEGLDIVVAATIRIEDGGKGTGSAADLAFARAVIQVEVKNAAKGKILGSLSESRKEGHRSFEEAQRRAVRTLAKKLTNQVGTQIDKTMKGL